MDFQIKLLPDDPEHVDRSRAEIIDRARVFAVKTLQRAIYNPESPSPGVEPRELSLTVDVLTARFWGALSSVDGRKYVVRAGHYPSVPTKTGEPLALENKQTRAWARDRFSPIELEELLNIAVNQALLRPHQTGWPGTRRGHSVLYEELLEKQDSMFKPAVTEELHQRLINGRFWEELPLAKVSINGAHGISVVKDILENHFSDLEPKFAVSHGLQLMRAANQQELDTLDLSYCGEVALGRYALLLSNIDQLRGVPTKTAIEELLGPYLSTVLEWDRDLDRPYYCGDMDSDDIPTGRFQDKLAVPIVQKYLSKSPRTREYLAKILAEGIEHRANSDGEYSKFVREVLESIPSPQDVMKLIAQQHQDRPYPRFLEQSEQHGYSLADFV